MMDSGNGSQEAETRGSGARSQEQSNSSSDAQTRSREGARRLSESEKTDRVRELLGGSLHPETPAQEPDDPGDGDDGESDLDGSLVPRGDRGDEQPGSEEEGQEDRSAPAPIKSLSDLADRVGVDVAELYDIELGTGDGETVKLGQMKDAWQNRQEAERETALRDTALDERETALSNEQRLWSELGDQLTRALSEEQQNALLERMQARERVERQRVLEAMPELRDQAKFEAFRGDLVEELGRYGFKPHEIVIGDHRQLLIMRDLMRARKRLKALADYKPKEKPPGGSVPKGRQPDRGDQNRARMMQRARSGGEADKVAGISALITGAGRNGKTR